ncbi:MAG: hypothetical protein KC561_03865 [Myxococcales bacterium]|nr:hypothetical protein [Myxococcales bacterium]
MRASGLVAALCVALSAWPAQAAPPDYRRPQVYFHPGLQMSQFFGSLEGSVARSIGFSITQGLQYRWIGLNLTIDTDYFLTSQDGLPFNSGLQTASFRLAGRFLVPVWNLRLFLEVAAARMSLVSNAVIEETGPELHIHSAGGALGVRYDLGGFYFELRTDVDYPFELDGGLLMTFSLGFGIYTLL